MGLRDTIAKALDARRRTVMDDLKILNEAHRGLGDDAARYVLGETDETVLSTLAAQPPDRLAALNHPWQPQGRGRSIEARRALFARTMPEDADFLRRYIEVVTPAHLAPHGPPGFAQKDRLVGTDQTPSPVRIFFTELLSTDHDPRSKHDRLAELPPERALTMTRALGGAAVDLFDCLFFEETSWSAYGFGYRQPYREREDLAAVAAAETEAVAAATRRLDAKSLPALLVRFDHWGVASAPAILDAVFALAARNAKSVREAVLSALAAADPSEATPQAIKALESGDATLRLTMAQHLARLDDPAAKAALRARLESEGASRVRAAIETALSAGAVAADASGGGADDADGYASVDGSRVEIPPLKPLKSGPEPRFGDEDQKALEAIVAAENALIEAANQARAGSKYAYRAPLINRKAPARIIRWLNAPTVVGDKRATGLELHRLGAEGDRWLRAALARLPQDLGVKTSIAAGVDPRYFMRDVRWAWTAAAPLNAYLDSEDADLRAVEAVEIELGVEREFGPWMKRTRRPVRKGDLLRAMIEADSYAPPPDEARAAAAWPYIAENLDVLDEAFGLSSGGDLRLSRARAIDALSVLPKTPMRYFAPLLEAATGETKTGRAEARALLAGAPGVDERLIALLQDKREAVRAGAATWLADRRAAAAVKPIEARLKKEKSDRARAALLTALRRLGGDLGAHLGPAALLKEAEAGLKKAKFDKLDWLGLDQIPALRWTDGSAVPDAVLRWWLFLAVKLKEPGGNGLFDLYADQLEPESAARFSTWVLDSWTDYDTERPSDEEGAAHAQHHLAQFRANPQWARYWTSEEAYLHEVKRAFMSEYRNSGAASKGVLALARRAPPSRLAERVRAYLREHGARTSQASALLEMLAGAGDPISLQVVIAAATRLKQKSVQKHAAALVERIAAERDWTMDELADRTIPTAGFDEDGRLALPFGAPPKRYEARIDDALKLALRNPEGRVVKAPPAGDDEDSKASKKQLSAAKKELKQIVAMQSARLYEALCAERSWALEDWRRDFAAHPVMRRLIERAVWLGLDAEGGVLSAFRPTAEGDFTDAEDEPVDLSAFAAVRLAHRALLTEADAAAWARHLEDYEVTPLFAQVSRPVLALGEGAADAAEIDDRKGWVTDAFTLRGAASKLGYERGGAEDGGFFTEYRKTFPSAGLTAVIEFTGNSLPEENVPAALIALRFERSGGRGRGVSTRLRDAPAVLLSECWNDYHAMAAKAAFDPEWEKRARW